MIRKLSTVKITLLIGLAAMAFGSQVIAEKISSPAEPLVLRKIMADMGKEMGIIAEAISREQWSQVEESAMKIADHPRPPMSERAKIMALFGTDMARFKGYDTKTHDTARILAEQAAEKNASAVISTFTTLQRSCLECHQNFRKPLQQHFYGKMAK